jgi:protein-tyrosine phosphatase
LTVADLEKAGRAVALRRHEHRAMMLQAHPEWVDRIDYWDVQDIDEIEPTEALPAIEQQVTALISLYA